MFASECGVCPAAPDVVCDVFDNGVWDVCLVQHMSECVHVDCVLISSATATVRSGGLF